MTVNTHEEDIVRLMRSKLGGILEGVRRKSLKNPPNFSNTQVRICVKDAKTLNWSCYHLPFYQSY